MVPRSCAKGTFEGKNVATNVATAPKMLTQGPERGRRTKNGRSWGLTDPRKKMSFCLGPAHTRVGRIFFT
jgi:hypothetical protein